MAETNDTTPLLRSNPKALIDRTGHRYNRWLVLERAANRSGNTQWFCRCECGTERIVAASDLASGHSQSCGCLQQMQFSLSITTQYHSTYVAWLSMRQRCHYAKRPDFHLYGGRGIRVCDRWLHDFAAFLQDMGAKPSPKHSLDRIDRDKDYTPDNCRWATQSEQMSHTIQTVLVMHDGTPMPLKAVADKLGLNYGRLRYSYRDKGLSLEDAIAEAQRPGIQRRSQSQQNYCLHGHELSGDNLILRQNDSRRCRICTRLNRERLRRAKGIKPRAEENERRRQLGRKLRHER